MPTASNFLTTGRTAAASALAGFAGGAWCGGLLYLLSTRAGGEGPAWPFILILSGAGTAFAVVLDRLLDWAWRDMPGQRRAWWSLAPWAWTLFGALFLAIPLPHDPAPGTPLGFYKHLLCMLYVGGVLVYSLAFLAPLWRDPSPRRAALMLGALALLLAPAPVLNPPTESDEGDYVAAALAWARTGTPRIATVVDDGTLEAFYFGKLPVTWLEYQQRLQSVPDQVPLYSYRMAGYPLILVPFVNTALLVSTPPLRWLLASLPGFLAFALLAAAIASLTGKGEGRSWALMGLATATPFLYFTTNIQPEVLMAALVAWSFSLGLEPRTRTRATAIALLSCLAHERLIIIVAPMVAWFLVTDPRQRMKIVIVSGLCALPVAASWFATQQFQVTSRLPHAYGDPGLAFWAPERWFRAAWMHLFSHSIGLLPHVPVLLAVPLAVHRAWRHRSPRPQGPVLAGLGLFACYFVILVTYPRTFDSWPHIRYLIPALPLLAPLLAWSGTVLSGRRGDRMVMGALLTVQALRTWPFLAVPQLWRAIGLWF